MKHGDWQKVGVIGVDAGLCWIGDPCYVVSKDASHVFKTWDEFCDQLSEDEISGVKQWNSSKGRPGLGVSVSTGYGDGEYPVYVKRNQEGRISEAKVVFISKDEEDE